MVRALRRRAHRIAARVLGRSLVAVGCREPRGVTLRDGSGPWGPVLFVLLYIAAAITLARGGREVLLVDKARFLGALDKAVPRGQTPIAYSLQQAAQVDKMVKGLRAKQFAGDAWDAMLQLALKVAS